MQQNHRALRFIDNDHVAVLVGRNWGHWSAAADEILRFDRDVVAAALVSGRPAALAIAEAKTETLGLPPLHVRGDGSLRVEWLPPGVRFEIFVDDDGEQRVFCEAGDAYRT